ncbi:MAG: hypothetical protein ABIZ36_03080, partial [Gemmatimonadaceae bacterium]
MKSILIAATALGLAASLPAQQSSIPLSHIRYGVTLDSAAAATQTLKVSMTFSTNSAGTILLSLPSWTPGAYVISNYARFVSGFGVSSGTDSLEWDKTDPDTWRISATRAGEVTVHFEYKADSLDNAMSWTKDGFGFFNGTNLFLYP